MTPPPEERVALRPVLDALAAQIVVVDPAGRIVTANAAPLASGLRDVLEGRAAGYALEYPDESVGDRRWMRVQVTPVADGDGAGSSTRTSRNASRASSSGGSCSSASATAGRGGRTLARRRWRSSARSTRRRSAGKLARFAAQSAGALCYVDLLREQMRVSRRHAAGGAPELAGESGTVLGVVEDPELPERESWLGAGDALVLYTDGLSEAGAPRELSWREIASAAGETSDGADAVAGRLEALALELGGGQLRDDVAILVMRVVLPASS